MTCPDDETIADLLADRLDDSLRHDLLSHLDACSGCRQLVADASLAAAGEAGDDDLRLEPGARVGRYVVGRVLGAGAMGVVHAAADPRLGREVALKVLRPHVVAGSDMLLAEAQTLARLNHPNIVAVHDAGEVQGNVFIALELVEGTTLRQWLAARHRGWKELREVFVQAGRGLEAAHAAGLVHRDFKPDNVLVGRDGRVRVTDFGLARGPAANEAQLAGTPAYMSPEQIAGAAVDARADLYSFCVTLVEAVTGRRARGEPLPLRGVPARARRALRRGLSRSAAARQATMGELLAELAPRPARRWAVAAAALLPALAVAGFLAWPRPFCTGAAAAWGSLWDDAQRARVRAAFAPAAVAFASVDAAFAGYRERWMRVHTAVCRATHVGEQSADLLDRRMACLDARRQEAAALADLFAAADPRIVDSAAELVGRLGGVDHCAAAVLSQLDVPPPAARAELALLAGHAARARAQLTVGRVLMCLAIAIPAVEEARRLGYRPALAQLLYYRGRCEPSDGRGRADLGDAAAAAIAGHDDETLARAWIGLMGAEARTDDARRWEVYARAVLDRMGGSDELELDFLQGVGWNLARDGRLDEQRAVAERARARVLAGEGPASPRLINLENQIASTFTNAWRFADALPHQQAAVAQYERIYGSDSPGLVGLLVNESVDLRGLGRFGEALALFDRILPLLKLRGGDDSWARTFHASALRDAGRSAEALDEDRRARATCERYAGAQGWRCALAWEGEGGDLLALGRADEAVAPLERARAIYGERPQPDSAFLLAQAVAGRDPRRARELALESLENLRALVAHRGGSRKRLDETEAWLRAHGGVPPP